MDEYLVVDDDGNIIELPPEELYKIKLSYLKQNLQEPYMLKKCIICDRDFVTLVEESQPVCSTVECNYEYIKQFIE